MSKNISIVRPYSAACLNPFCARAEHSAITALARAIVTAETAAETRLTTTGFPYATKGDRDAVAVSRPVQVDVVFDDKTERMRGLIDGDPLIGPVAAISVGIIDGERRERDRGDLGPGQAFAEKDRAQKHAEKRVDVVAECRIERRALTHGPDIGHPVQRDEGGRDPGLRERPGRAERGAQIARAAEHHQNDEQNEAEQTQHDRP